MKKQNITFSFIFAFLFLFSFLTACSRIGVDNKADTFTFPYSVKCVLSKDNRKYEVYGIFKTDKMTEFDIRCLDTDILMHFEFDDGNIKYRDDSSIVLSQNFLQFFTGFNSFCLKKYDETKQNAFAESFDFSISELSYSE